MYAVRRPVDNVYLVRERDRRRTRELLALALAALPPMAVLFAAIWANLETVRLGYQLERLQKQREALVEKGRQLRTARAESAALDRVEAIARGTLGLRPPRLDQVILIRDSVLSPPELIAAVPVPAPPSAPADPLLEGPPSPVPSASAPISGSTEEGF
jgi:cell division protein FtsL